MESAGVDVNEGILITADRIIQLGALITAIGVIVALFVKFHNWYLKQAKQDKDIQNINEELTLLTFGELACLKGLQKMGCDGPVTEAVDKLEKHLNKKAHGQT